MVFQPGDDAKEALAAVRVFANNGESPVSRVQNEGGKDGHGLAGLDGDHRGRHDVTCLVKVQVQSVKNRHRSRSYRQKNIKYSVFTFYLTLIGCPTLHTHCCLSILTLGSGSKRGIHFSSSRAW